MSRDQFYTPALNDTDALSLAGDDFDAMVRRHELPADAEDWRRNLVRQIADAYIASNRSTMRVQQLLTLAGERWMQDHGRCALHGLVDVNHRCRDYDGQSFSPQGYSFSPRGYAPQGYEAAADFLLKH